MNEDDNNKFRAFLDQMPDAFFAHDTDGKLIHVNQQACNRLGYSPAELLGMSIGDLIPQLDPAITQACRKQSKVGELLSVTGTLRHKNGTSATVEIHLSISLVNNQKIILGLLLDPLENSVGAIRQDRLSKLYKALSEVNQAIVRLDDESALFPLVCRMAVDFGGLKMAWIGQFNATSKLIEPVVSYGFGIDHLDEIVAAINVNLPAEYKRGGEIFQQNRSLIINNISTDQQYAQWRDHAQLYGWGSIGVFPIFRNGKLFALLIVYHEQSAAFDDEIIRLLHEMSGDITFALDNFDRENERRQAAEILRISEDKYAKTFRNSPNPISITTLDGGRFIEVNEAWTRITGYTYDEAIGRTVAELGIWKSDTDHKMLTTELANKGRAVDFEFVFNTKTGEVTCLVSAEIVEIQREQCLVLVAQDISGLKQAMETINEQKNFLNAILESEPECVKVVSRAGKLVQMNSAGLAMLEVNTLEEAQNLGLLAFILPSHKKAFAELHKNVCAGKSGVLEFLVAGKKGTRRWLETHATPLRNANGEIIALLGITRDITEKKLTDELIWKQANFDLLTTLPNRFMFYDRLAVEIKKTHRDENMLALLFIDLDRFKEVNDTLGHQIGDMLLVEAANRIVSCVRQTDTVARLGGDEFTVILSQLHDASYIDEIAANINAILAEPFTVEGELGQLYISASIGITLYPSDGTDVEQLLRNADQAMYVAKNSGRNRFSYFTHSMQEQAQLRLSLLNDLRGALSENQLALYFQPIIDMSTGNIIKAEALLRWHHPRRGLISPMEFIPLAEETGLIVEIGDWVFKEAARWVSRRIRQNENVVQVSVNMSPIEFHSESTSIASRLSYLQELGITGHSMAIEITEGLLLKADPGITDKLIQFRNAGIQVAIDDFGTGYSALSYLKKFDIDYLKLDQSFVRDLATDPDDMALSEAIIAMAHKLGLKVIAEGVETVEQMELLADAGCDYAQGYLYSKPVPAHQFELLLENSHAIHF